ncbi:hypothetical protein Nepgr_002817 [Nepenthes gracilis]|uniref:Transmembrane protein n=1 Tax=Nepenthes gracilis TaxID=150966 RepID=A0AAD3RYG9_NEPGR|nr:hypothetical protein Nepgr_002817 [Nepenthes gracilis]
MAGILGATPDAPRLDSPPVLAGAVSSKVSSNSIPYFPLADADGHAPGSLTGNDLPSSPLRYSDCSSSLRQTLNPPSGANDHMVRDLVVQCPQFAEQIVAEDLEEASASRPPPPAVVSLSLDDARFVVSSQVGVHPNEASGKPLIGRTDPRSEPGFALMDSEGSLSPSDQDDDPLQVDHHRAVFHHERLPVSFPLALRHGLVTTGPTEGWFFCLDQESEYCSLYPLRTTEADGFSSVLFAVCVKGASPFVVKPWSSYGFTAVICYFFPWGVCLGLLRKHIRASVGTLSLHALVPASVFWHLARCPFYHPLVADSSCGSNARGVRSGSSPNQCCRATASAIWLAACFFLVIAHRFFLLQHCSESMYWFFTIQVMPVFGGDLSPCSNLQQPDDSAALAVPSTSVRVDSTEGFMLKSILKNLRRTKQKRSPRSANQA